MGGVVATETGSNTRTIKGYVVRLLEYPRWLIEREVDFTDCRRDGRFNEYLSECAECRFGGGCRWLDLHRAPTTEQASLDDLIEALEGAVAYLTSPQRPREAQTAEVRNWVREAQRFLGSRHS